MRSIFVGGLLVLIATSAARGASVAAMDEPADAGAPDANNIERDAETDDASTVRGTDANTPVATPAPTPVSTPEVISLPSGKKKKHTLPSDSSPNTQASEDEGGPQEEEAAPKPSVQGDAFGDDGPSSKRLGTSVRLLLQTRYTHVWRDNSDQAASSSQDADGYQLNRAFVRIAARANDWLSAKVLVDFAQLAYNTPLQALKLAYGEVRVSKRVEVTFGLFKRTYSLLELLPIATFEFADTGPTDTLIKNTQFAGRDVGAMVRVDPLPRRRWLHVYLGTFGGAGFASESVGTGTKTGPDGASTSALLTARLMSRPIKHLSLGGDVAWRPTGQAPSTSGGSLSQPIGPGLAISADATFSTKMIELRAEWLRGDRTDVDSRGDARTFVGAWGIAAIRLPAGAVVVMPAFRFEWLDSDREHPVGDRVVYSGALNIDVTDYLRLVGDFSRAIVQPGSVSLTSGNVDASATVFVFQAQLKV